MSGVFTWVPTEAEGPGNYAITVRATDSGTPQLDDFESIVITVLEVQQPPTARDSTAQTDEDTRILITLPVDDPDGLESLTLTLKDASQVKGSVGFTVTASAVTMSYDPSNVLTFQSLSKGEALTDVIVYQAVDGNGEVANATITLTVLGKNDWHNSPMPTDVSKDGALSPIDALLVINHINATGTGPAPAVVGEPVWFYDTNNDNMISPVDVLLVINAINGQSGAGEASSRHTNGPLRTYLWDEKYTLQVAGEIESGDLTATAELQVPQELPPITTSTSPQPTYDPHDRVMASWTREDDLEKSFAWISIRED